MNQVIAAQSQIYSATVINKCGEQLDEMDLEIDYRNPTYPFDQTVFICPNDTINLDVTQDFEASYFWNTGSNSPIIELATPGKYDVTISTDCVSKTFDFDVVPGACDFIPKPFIPNVFSPNGDNVNDDFIISSFPYVDLFEIQFTIFDRWGNMIFRTDQIPLEWNGQYKGSALKPGVFVYHAIFTNKATGVQFDMTGDVTLVK